MTSVRPSLTLVDSSTQLCAAVNLEAHSFEGRIPAALNDRGPVADDFSLRFENGTVEPLMAAFAGDKAPTRRKVSRGRSYRGGKTDQDPDCCDWYPNIELELRPIVYSDPLFERVSHFFITR